MQLHNNELACQARYVRQLACQAYRRTVPCSSDSMISISQIIT